MDLDRISFLLQRVCTNCWIWNQRTKAYRQSKGEKKYTFSFSSTLFFRCFKTLGAGCKPLPLKTRKCLHFPKLLCLGIFWQKSDLIGVLVDIDWEIGSRSIVPIFRSHYSRRLLTILICLLLYSIPGQSGDEDVMVQMVK